MSNTADRPHSDARARRPRIRVVVAIGIVAALGSASYRLLNDDGGRHEFEGLSCPTESFGTSAADFQSIPTWATSTEALEWLKTSVPGVRPDGWELELQESQTMRWIRKTDGHVVSIATFTWAGSGWAYESLTACGDEG
jgi:hypothetical protein